MSKNIDTYILHTRETDMKTPLKIEQSMNLAELAVCMGGVTEEQALEMRELLMKYYCGKQVDDVPDARWFELGMEAVIRALQHNLRGSGAIQIQYRLKK